MALAFNIFLHVLLIGSVVLFAWALIRMTLSVSDPQERVLRMAALFAGAMVTLGASVSGVGIAQYTVEALAGARPASAVAEVGATLIPALLGAGIGFYVARVYKRSERMAGRVMAFIGMLSITAFAGLYATATQVNGVLLGRAALPNIAFVLGVILCILFTWDPDERGGRSALVGLGELVRRRGSRGSSGGLADPFAGPTSAKRDPFAP